MLSNFITDDKTYCLKTDKYVCNKFGLAEVFSDCLDNIYHNFPTEILDVGCGAGPLSIFLADRFHCQITATDINARACDLCRLNAEQYGLQQEISIVQADFRNFSDITGNRKYDLIVSAPPVDENVSESDISLFVDNDFSSLDDKSFSFLTNSWCDENGNDLSDYIFQYASSHLNKSGNVIIVFCDVDCHSEEYVVKKALIHGFHVAQSVSLIIPPERLGVENFIKRGICVYLLRFQKEKINGYQSEKC